jgi:nucleoside-diphosphate-sugar epimerase
MKVFVAGATGVIGSRAVRELVAAGHEVTGIARSPEKAAQLRAAGARPVLVSLWDRDGLRAEIAGHDAVVNLATHIPPISKAMVPGAWDENERIRREGAANLVDAAVANGASRYIQESITFTYPESGDAWIDAETTPIDTSGLLSVMEAAEGSAARFTEQGGTGVVLRFGMFIAPGSNHTNEAFRGARARIGGMAGRPGAYHASIQADDAARAVVAALDVPAGTYDVVDDEPLTTSEYVKAIGDAVGRRPLVRFPGRLIGLAPPAAFMGRSQRVSNRRFREATGWAPQHPSAREAYAAAAADTAGGAAKAPLLERLVGPVLLILALSALQLGVWATFAPESFYEDFPPGGARWVAIDGPYNEHFVRDFGGLNLALAVLLFAAWRKPEPYLVRTAALASMLFALPHLTYHAFNLEPYETGDAIANIVLLAVAVILPAILIVGTATTSRSSNRTPQPGS